MNLENDDKYKSYIEKKKKEDMKWVTLSMGAPFILLLITFKAGKELSDIIGTLAGTFWIVYIVWCFNRFEKEQALAILCANVFCLGILFSKVYL
ncbi:hypothetical protein LV478_11820 [Komagataeibacter oboediens]|uniref:hypothetical protein n=1 Tax=Komagataeibacter oboediens TaxID=65958 RepID=UPI0023DC8492|nr:hypothetical protein [Komagataeibacter oboediens]WEQ51218.1 hypothetical protein LV478_11820 [Komagataeibacter oboediens]